MDREVVYEGDIFLKRRLKDAVKKRNIDKLVYQDWKFLKSLLILMMRAMISTVIRLLVYRRSMPKRGHIPRMLKLVTKL